MWGIVIVVGLLLVIGWWLYILSVPTVIIGIVIGAFFFIGAPVYAILNYIEKGKEKIKDEIKMISNEKTFEQYDRDTLKEEQNNTL